MVHFGRFGIREWTATGEVGVGVLPDDNGELIKNQEHKARLMFEEKVKRLREMKSLE